jgi:hypothetical protein
MNITDLAKQCGATFYTHRTSPHQAAVAFGPAAWEKFIKATEQHLSQRTVLLDPGCAERGCMAHDARDGTVHAQIVEEPDPCPNCRPDVRCRTPFCGRLKQDADRLKGGKTGWPPGLLQDDNANLSKWFASRPDARHVVRSMLDEHEALTFHKLEDKS